MRMYDFDSLLDEILSHRPELTRDQIMEQIQVKKRDVGAGFLTEQGALFLIAGELGVQLKHMTSTDLTLKDIYAGANDITIVREGPRYLSDQRVQEEGWHRGQIQEAEPLRQEQRRPAHHLG